MVQPGAQWNNSYSSAALNAHAAFITLSPDEIYIGHNAYCINLDAPHSCFQLLCKYRGQETGQPWLSFWLWWVLGAEPLKLSWPSASRRVCAVWARDKGLTERQEEFLSQALPLCLWRKLLLRHNAGLMFTGIAMKTKGEWMIQTTAAESAASAALGALKDF